MVRDTSVATFHQIKTEGLLSQQRQVVYDILFERGPMTAMEMRDRHLDRASMHAWKRLPELRDLGVVSEVGERECQITGHIAMLWDVTSKLPDIPERKMTSKQRIKELEAENAQLRATVQGLRSQLLMKRFGT